MFDPVLWLGSLLPFFQTSIGAAFFVPVYALWVTLLLPGVWASMIAGAIYGIWLGSILVFLGAFLGAEITFLLARTLLHDWAQRHMSERPKLLAVKKAVSKEGLKLVVLTRLSPAFPFSLLNLVYGLSEVTFVDYTIGLIGILPGTILFCGLGAIAGDLARFDEVLKDGTDPNLLLLRFIGLFATIAVVWLVARAVRRALHESDVSI